jgi:uncharacterized protein (DUF2252 family)
VVDTDDTLTLHRHLRSERVLCQADGSPLSADIVKHHVERAASGAQIKETVSIACAIRSVHIRRCGVYPLGRFRSLRVTMI